jgi:hypothetical protein
MTHLDTLVSDITYPSQFNVDVESLTHRLLNDYICYSVMEAL